MTAFSSQHPSGKLAILTCGGKGTTAEFDAFHPPDVIGKYVSDAIIGVVGSGKTKKVKGAVKSALTFASSEGDADAG